MSIDDDMAEGKDEKLVDKVRREFKNHKFFEQYVNIAESFDKMDKEPKKISAELRKMDNSKYDISENAVEKGGSEYKKGKHEELYEAILENIAKRHGITYHKGMSEGDREKARTELRRHLSEYNPEFASEHDLRTHIEKNVAIDEDTTEDDLKEDVKKITDELGARRASYDVGQAMLGLDTQDYKDHAKKGEGHHRMLEMMHHVSRPKRKVGEQKSFQHMSRSGQNAAIGAYQATQQERYQE